MGAGQIEVASCPVDFLVVLNHDSILQDGYSRRLKKFIAVVFGRGKENIVSLPVTCRSARVHKRRSLTVDGTA